MTVISAHHRADHFAIHFRHQKQADVVIQLALNIHLRIVPRAQQIAALPQRHNLFEILLAKNANLHGIPHH
ncbi:hypothetical protein UUU_30670 [Klebsiella pneumoniae subsp. pneumoniae DSM 30104 = JCM 1662 = NBRC 14940]|nr:hypothetical protein UUU_30670 [Klebsiella pneumoniae subsp. pneumoniae DSM 30104 = JCM 1662 = NBRC 14940]